MMRIVDIHVLVSIAKTYHSWVCVDNTLPHPTYKIQLTWVNIVAHSVTKYISGHSDVVMVRSSPMIKP